MADYIELSEEVTMALAEKIHALSIEEYKKRKEEAKKAVLQRTRKMAQNYRYLRKQLDDYIKTIDDTDDYRANKIRQYMREPFRYDDDVEALNICNWSINALDLLRFEKTIEVTEEYYRMIKGNDIVEKFRTFRKYYMEGDVQPSIKELSEEEGIDQRQLYRDFEQCIEKITMGITLSPI